MNKCILYVPLYCLFEIKTSVFKVGYIFSLKTIWLKSRCDQNCCLQSLWTNSSRRPQTTCFSSFHTHSKDSDRDSKWVTSEQWSNFLTVCFWSLSCWKADNLWLWLRFPTLQNSCCCMRYNLDLVISCTDLKQSRPRPWHFSIPTHVTSPTVTLKTKLGWWAWPSAFSIMNMGWFPLLIPYSCRIWIGVFPGLFHRGSTGFRLVKNKYTKILKKNRNWIPKIKI